jgi:hypothetical protein
MKPPLGRKSLCAHLKAKILAFKRLRKPENAKIWSGDTHLLQDLSGKTLVEERTVALGITTKLSDVPIMIFAKHKPSLRSSPHTTRDTGNDDRHGVQSGVLKVAKGSSGGAFPKRKKSTMCIRSDPRNED